MTRRRERWARGRLIARPTCRLLGHPGGPTWLTWSDDRSEVVRVCPSCCTWPAWSAERAAAYARARGLGNALAGGLAVALPTLLVLAYLAWWA